MKRFFIIITILFAAIFMSSCMYADDGYGLAFDLQEDGTYGVRGYINSREAVIPAKHRDKDVTKILDNGFKDNTNLQSITIPDSITSIGKYAFENCRSIENIKIPESVTEICDGAFKGCAFFSITIPKSVTRIEGYTFEGNHRLKKVTLPESVNWIDYRAFADCSALKSITLPEGLICIGKEAFSGCYFLPDLVIPTSVKYIDDGAFAGCSAFKNLVFPESVTSIGDRAFYECGLESVVIPASATIGKNQVSNSCSFYYNGTLENWCKKKIAYNANIGYPAYHYIKDEFGTVEYNNDKYSMLTNITIPDTITSIKENTFYYCVTLSSVTIPNTVTSIEKNAFLGCDSLVKINYNGTKEEWKAIKKDMSWNSSISVLFITCKDGACKMDGSEL